MPDPITNVVSLKVQWYEPGDSISILSENFHDGNYFPEALIHCKSEEYTEDEGDVLNLDEDWEEDVEEEECGHEIHISVGKVRLPFIHISIHCAQGHSFEQIHSCEVAKEHKLYGGYSLLHISKDQILKDISRYSFMAEKVLQREEEPTIMHVPSLWVSPSIHEVARGMNPSFKYLCLMDSPMLDAIRVICTYDPRLLYTAVKEVKEQLSSNGPQKLLSPAPEKQSVAT